MKRECGTWGNAFSSELAFTSLPVLRATTILLVPTSMPMGFELVSTNFSISSCEAVLGFQRWSFRSLI